jgi:hypothetical protein
MKTEIQSWKPTNQDDKDKKLAWVVVGTNLKPDGTRRFRHAWINYPIETVAGLLEYVGELYADYDKKTIFIDYYLAPNQVDTGWEVEVEDEN